jgi:hypothetical protein
MWSLRKGREAEVRKAVLKQAAAQKKLAKAQKKQDQEDSKIQK